MGDYLAEAYYKRYLEQLKEKEKLEKWKEIRKEKKNGNTEENETEQGQENLHKDRG